jgi:hypothetical protein
MKWVVQFIRAYWLFAALIVLWAAVQLLVPVRPDDGIEHKVTVRYWW